MTNICFALDCGKMVLSSVLGLTKTRQCFANIYKMNDKLGYVENLTAECRYLSLCGTGICFSPLDTAKVCYGIA